MARSWLHRIRETGDFSDVTVYVEDQAFYLHVLPLICASSYFRSLLTTSSSNSVNHLCGSYAEACSENDSSTLVSDSINQNKCTQVIDLNAMGFGAQAFSIAVDYCYLIKPSYTVDNVVEVRAAAEFLGIAELVESSKKFLYANVFNHWKNAIDFLQQYTRLGSSADEYVETRCIRAIAAACKKAFSDTQSLSAPIKYNDLTNEGSILNKVSTDAGSRSSVPSHEMLSIVLVKICSLRDEIVEKIIEELVSAEANLSLNCRQGRNVKEWLHNTLSMDGCRSNRERSWVVVCLTRLLQKSCSTVKKLSKSADLQRDPSSLELSSHYWCALLQEASSCVKKVFTEMEEGSVSFSDRLKNKLLEAKSFLEERIGRNLNELDDYLRSYRLDPQVLLSLVRYFRGVQTSPTPIYSDSPKEGEIKASASTSEVAEEVDSCLWNLLDEETFSAKDFIFLVEAFPAQSRKSHDLLYAAVEKFMEKKKRMHIETVQKDEKIDGDKLAQTEQKLWSLVDVTKLSRSFYYRAISNPEMLKRSEVIEYVLRQQMRELEKNLVMEASINSDGIRKCTEESTPAFCISPTKISTQKLRHIMQQVVQASLKLLEENSRRAREISELRRQYSDLLLIS